MTLLFTSIVLGRVTYISEHPFPDQWYGEWQVKGSCPLPSSEVVMRPHMKTFLSKLCESQGHLAKVSVVMSEFLGLWPGKPWTSSMHSFNIPESPRRRGITVEVTVSGSREQNQRHCCALCVLQEVWREGGWLAWKALSPWQKDASAAEPVNKESEGSGTRDIFFYLDQGYGARQPEFWEQSR